MFMACGPEKFRYAQDDFVLTHSSKTQAFVNGVTHSQTHTHTQLLIMNYFLFVHIVSDVTVVHGVWYLDITNSHTLDTLSSRFKVQFKQLSNGSYTVVQFMCLPRVFVHFDVLLKRSVYLHDYRLQVSLCAPLHFSPRKYLYVFYLFIL